MLKTYVKSTIMLNDMKAKLHDIRTDDEGASLIEYSILIGLISAAVIATIALIKVKVTNSWTGINTADWGT